MISVEEFNALIQEEQIARIQKLGEAALAEFGVTPDRIEPLVHGENTTFHVFSEIGEFNLRISRPGYQSSANIDSEIAFLSALRAAGFRVPDPYRARRVPAQVEEVPEARDCVLFRWMNGEFRQDAISAREAHLVGQTMARLQNFAQTWTPPSGFTRQQIQDSAFQPRPRYVFDEPIPGVLEEDRQLLLEIDATARALLPRLPKTPDSFGLIHADLHVGNLLFEDGQLNVIDFDDTGYAFLLHDFASALAYQVAKPNYIEVRDALTQGYEEFRTLPPGFDELLNPFLRMRLAGISKWLLERTDNPKFRTIAPEWTHSLMESARMLR